MTGLLQAPFHELPHIGSFLGITLGVQRDDLLPFPLASSKVRAIEAELDGRLGPETALITNGSVDSNHCRTLALWGAQRGIPVHLVLHGEAELPASKRAMILYHALGAIAEVVSPGEIARVLTKHIDSARAHGNVPLVIPGGCHTPRAAMAYRDAAIPILQDWQPDIVFVASGTGAIQGGLVAAAHYTSSSYSDHRRFCRPRSIQRHSPSSRGCCLGRCSYRRDRLR